MWSNRLKIAERFVRAVASSLVLISIASGNATGQDADSRRSHGVHAVLGVSVFPSYIVEDRHTRQWGPALSVHLGTTRNTWLEIGYAYVPQSTTTASSSPRLHVVRGMYSASLPTGTESPVRVSLSGGAAVLKLDAQTVDCGPFPLCAEWSPNSGTRFAPVLAAGIEVRPLDRLALVGGVRAYHPLGDSWSPAGDEDLLAEITAGLSVSF